MGMYETIGITAMMLGLGLVVIISLMDEKPKIFDKIFESNKAILILILLFPIFFHSCHTIICSFRRETCMGCNM